MDVPADQRYRLLGLSGSLRRASNATAVLRTLADRLAPDISMDIFDVGRLPLYNEDLDDEGEVPVEPPAAVTELRALVRACDGIVVVSPEYNHGIPGVLKNAIDWASRPGYSCPLTGKPVKVMTTATSPLGGARAQAWLNEAFHSTLSRVVPGKQVVIGRIATKVKEGRLVDEDTINFALNAIDQLIDEAILAQRRPARVIPEAWRRKPLAGRPE